MFAGTVIGTLGLGIAGVTTLASIVWGVLLAPLPYANADRLVAIWHNGQARHPSMPRMFSLSHQQVEAFRQARTIEELTFAEAYGGTATLHTDGFADVVDVTYTAGNFLSFLGAGAALGRLYGLSDEAGDEPVVVLAHNTWVRRYGSDPGVLGTHVSLGTRSYRVIGVLEAGFRYVLYPKAVEYWIPRALQPNRAYNYTALAHIEPSVTLDDVSRELGTMVIRLFEEDGFEPLIGPEDAAPVLYVREAVFELSAAGVSSATGRRVWVLFGAGAIVLLLACANVASLLLVSAAERSQELALRGAIGAGRGRLAVHLLSEAMVLSFLGGAFGAALTPVAMWLLKMGAPEGIPRLESVTVGWPMLASGLLVTTATVLLIGTLPAWAHSRPPLARGLHGGGSGARGTPTASRLRSGLLVAQVCGAFVVLLGTGLLIRSYRELATVDLGFRSDGLLYGQVALPRRVFES
ncbi:MAG: ABC transporter permease, partial [Longimicrobiales bacterium]